MNATEGLHNNPRAVKAKIELRRNVLTQIQPASVFDGFAGRGEMYRGAWHEAAEYCGCDLTWRPSDPGRRFAADNRRVLRSIDLSRFNVFDFDAFGAPWEQMIILAAKRSWAPGERGAVVLTDGSSGKSKFGGSSHAIAELGGFKRTSGLAPGQEASRAQQSIALTAWCRRAGVAPVRMWQAESLTSGKGSQRMLYTAVVFCGVAQMGRPGRNEKASGIALGTWAGKPS